MEDILKDPFFDGLSKPEIDINFSNAIDPSLIALSKNVEESFMGSSTMIEDRNLFDLTKKNSALAEEESSSAGIPKRNFKFKSAFSPHSEEAPLTEREEEKKEDD